MRINRSVVAFTFILFLGSCVSYKKSFLTMIPVAETIAIDPKKNMVYVIFRCKDTIDSYCGMMVQFDLELYGETYIGHKKPINQKSIN